MGQDCSKHRPVDLATYNQLRQESVAELVAAGLAENSISRHKANWCVIAASGDEIKGRAMLVDVGNVVVTQDALDAQAAK